VQWNDAFAAGQAVIGSAACTASPNASTHLSGVPKPACGTALNASSSVYGALSEAFLICEDSGTTVGDSVAGQDITINPTYYNWSTGEMDPAVSWGSYWAGTYITIDTDATGPQINGTSAPIGSNGPFSIAILVQAPANPVEGPPNNSPTYLGFATKAGLNSSGGIGGFTFTEWMAEGLPGFQLTVLGGGSPMQAVYPGSIRDGNWHFLAVTTDGTLTAAGTQMYLDGAALTLDTADSVDGSGGAQSDAGIALSVEATDGSATPTSIATLQFFNAALTLAQIAALSGDPYYAWRAGPAAPPPAPVLGSISPASGGAGDAVPVTLSGGNFNVGASVAVDDPYVTVSNVTVVSATQITATFTIAAGATPGTANVSVATVGGTSASLPFTVE